MEHPLVGCGTIAHSRCVAVWKRMWRWRRSQSIKAVTAVPAASPARSASWPAAGNVTRVEIVEANPRRVFDRAVVRALSQWRYSDGAAGRTVDMEIAFRR